jgi:hypothetical protein
MVARPPHSPRLRGEVRLPPHKRRELGWGSGHAPFPNVVGKTYEARF